LANLSGGLDKIARQMRAEGWYTADPALAAIEAAATAARAAIGFVLPADELPPYIPPPPPPPFTMPRYFNARPPPPPPPQDPG
jgi:hypothetical protein